MRVRICLLLPLLSVFALSAACADDQVRAAQENLKTLGFYTGPANGELDAQTKGAIKRYQVRNGLDATGELSADTVTSLNKASEPVAPEPTEAQPPATAPAQPAEQGPARVLPAPPVPPSGAAQSDRDYLKDTGRQARPAVRPEGAPNASSDPAYANLFMQTPFRNAPSEVQRDTVRRAQTSLAQRGLFEGEIDGRPGPDLEEGLLRFQSAKRLPRTGRLDMDTLASMHLLPTSRAPMKPFRPTPPRPDGAIRGVPLD